MKKNCSQGIRIGVPDIYVLNPVEDCALSGEDWEEIRSIWENYRKKNGLS